MTARMQTFSRYISGLPETLRDWGNGLILLLGLWSAGGLLWLFVRPGAPADQPAMSALFFVPVMLGAAVLSLRVALRPSLQTRLRRAWGIISLALLCYAGAFAFWYLQRGSASAIAGGSWDDLLFLCYYGLLLWGLLTLPSVPLLPSERARFWLDASTVLVCGWMLGWHYFIGPIARESGWHGLDSVLLFAYPLGDVLVLFGALVIWLRRDPLWLHQPIALLTAGVTTFVIGDMGWAYLEVRELYWPGQWPDGLYLLGAFLMALCAHQQYQLAGVTPPIRQAGALRPRSPAPWLPYSAMALVYVVLLAETRSHQDPHLSEMVFAAVAVTVAVAIRQLTIQRENVRLATENAASRGEARFRSLIHHSSEAILIIRVDGAVIYQSPSVERVFGWTARSLSGRGVIAMIHPDNRREAVALLNQIAAEPGAERVAHWRFRHQDGSWRHAESSIQNLLHDENVGGLVLNARDISDRKVLEEQLRHRASHDPLTGLANRTLFQHQVELALLPGPSGTRPVTVMFVDLDDFKTVNDSLGHGAGDDLLVIVAQRLRTCCEALVARLGGDEFAVLVTGVDDEGVRLRAERVLERLGQPVSLGARIMVAQASIGIATAMTGELKASDLLRNADMALYGAKRAGKNRHAIYDPAMHEAVTERLELTAGLRRALEKDQFLLHYQPIVSLESGRVMGVEALLRWEHPHLGQIPPSRFIGLAEETGVIIPLGRWVLTEACRQAARWQQSHPGAYVSVNLSPHQLHHPDLVDEVRRALHGSGLQPQRLMLEVTESSLLESSEMLRANAQKLKAAGVRFALDDFGAGHASIGYLRWFPVDMIKLDQSLVAELGTVPQRSMLVRGILNLARAAGLAAVAEGVERPEQVAALKALGCEMGQGYLFGRPAAEPDLEGRLKSRTS